MAEKWVTDTLCQVTSTVRVEQGPQIVELDCTDENLQDTVTHTHYRLGGRDAYGHLIRPNDAIDKMEAGGQDASLLKTLAAADKALGNTTVEKDQKMSVVDYRGVHAPHLWKVYQLTDVEEYDFKERKT